MAGRVLMVTSNYPRWAGDSTTPFVLHLARDLQALGWEMLVLAPHAPGAAQAEILDEVRVERFRYLLPESAQTVCYNGGSLGNLRRNPLNFFKLPMLVAAEWAATRARLASRRFDLVHSHWILPQGFVCSLSAKPRRIPHVTTIHGGDVFALRNAPLDLFRRQALKAADCVTVNSSATQAEISRLVPAHPNVVRIPMGAGAAPADPARVAKLRSQYRIDAGRIVLFVGRLIEEKGPGDLIAALPAVLASRPDTTLLIAGEGPDRARFEQQARALGLESRVTFTGWIDARELPHYLAAADVFAGPSKRGANGWVEAQGLTFAEALLAGLPVVATASGGIPDLIRHEETGLLVPEGQPAQIAAALLRLLDDPALAQTLARQGQELARREFTRAASAHAFSREFERLLGAAQPGTRSKK